MYRILGEITNFKLLQHCSWYSTRVRFAPSPTGDLHVGGLKTALINYLFAKSNDGKNIFRLEDTDRERYDPISLKSMIESLNWLGIKFDEGIENGNVSPDHMQSNRLSHYHSAIDELLANGKAYRCFCSQKRLNFIKKEQSRLGETPNYDRKCSQLTDKMVSELLQQGSKFVIRLRVADRSDTEFIDGVFGQIAFPGESIDVDPILIKSDRYPVYHFANVVDDHLMGITHVIRGQEWISSTPKHILLYQALGWRPPQFAHLPLIMKEDGHKVSKRDPNFLKSHYNVKYLLEKGYMAESVMSWLMSCGGGLTCDWHPKISQSELIDQFSLSRVTTHNATLNESLLNIASRSQLTSLSVTNQYFNEVISPFLARHNEIISYEQFRQYFPIIKHRLTCLSDILEYSFIWSSGPVSLQDLIPLIKPLNITESEAVTQLLHRLLSSVQSNKDVAEILENLCDGICSKASAMKCLRKMLIDKLEGPKISELLTLMSKDQIIHRINSVLK